MKYKRITYAAICLAATLVLVWHPASSAYRARMARKDLEAIRRDKSGVLHEFGIHGLDDVRMIESYGPLARLVMPEDRGKIARLLAILANAWECHPSRSPSRTGGLNVLLVTKDGRGVSIHIGSGEYLMNPKTGAFFAFDGAFKWGNAISRDSELRNRDSHLYLPRLESIRLDLGAGKPIPVGCNVTVRGNGSAMSVGRVVLDMLSYVDRRCIGPLERFGWLSEADRDYRPKPSADDPVIYLRLAEPLEENLLYAPWDPTPSSVVIHAMREDHFSAREIAIYRVTTKKDKAQHMVVALIPTKGRKWYWTCDPGKYGDAYYGRHLKPAHPILGNTDEEWKDPVQSLYQRLADQLTKKDAEP